MSLLIIFYLVPKAGLEPARTKVRWILSPVRLPISPLRQWLKAKMSIIDVKFFLSIQFVIDWFQGIFISARFCFYQFKF